MSRCATIKKLGREGGGVKAVRVHLKPMDRSNSKPQTVVILEGPTPDLGDSVYIDGSEHVVTEIEPTWAWIVKPGTSNVPRSSKILSCHR